MKDILKNNTVTMIKMNTLNDFQNKTFENVVQPEIAKIFDKSDEKFIAVEEINGADVLFLFVEERKVNALINLLEKHGMMAFSKEVSEEVLMGDLDVEFLGMMMSDEFKSMFDSFILKNLDSDMVLDKIIAKGMKSLTENDKIILEKAA